MDRLKTISEVCKELGMTSRTVRYYEQCGLITTHRTGKNAPRRLDGDNIERLRRIRFLRKLGLALDEIGGVIGSEEQAAEMIRTKSLQMRGEINAMILRVNMLKEVLAAAEKGENIFAVEYRLEQPPDEPEMLRIASECTQLMLERRFAELMPYLDSDMRRMTPEIIGAGWDAHTESCGAFVSVGEQRIVADTVINRLHFEKADIAVLIEVHAGLVTGALLQYLES